MCELFSCVSLSFMDSVISALIFVLNGLYVAWGWFAPNDDGREKLEEQIKKLRNYVNLFTYSDSALLIMKIVILALLRYLCCKKNNDNEQEDSNVSNAKVFNFNIPGITPVKKQNVATI